MDTLYQLEILAHELCEHTFMVDIIEKFNYKKIFFGGEYQFEDFCGQKFYIWG